MTEEVIKYKERMGQLKSFRQLFIGKHTPSDIDLAYEIGGRVFVFGELKLAVSMCRQDRSCWYNT